MSHRIVGSNFDTMSRETTSHPAASKALPIDFVPQNSSSSLGMFNNYHQRNKARTGKGAAQAVSHARTNLFLIGDSQIRAGPSLSRSGSEAPNKGVRPTTTIHPNVPKTVQRDRSKP